MAEGERGRDQRTEKEYHGLQAAYGTVDFRAGGGASRKSGGGRRTSRGDHPIQALTAKYLVEHASELTEKLIDVPEEVDKDVARRKLAFLGKEIDVLTPEQERYLNSYSL